jgi:outer membrane lipase/esterase
MKIASAVTHLLCASALCFSSPAQTSSFSNIFVFGDSLSDNGNLFSLAGIPGEPYWEGRFSNGPVWVEQLARELGLDPSAIENFAIVGSPTTLVTQAQIPLALFFNVNRLPPDALYVFWAGVNDMLGLLDGVGDVPPIITEAMVQTTAALTSLANAGAVTVLVPNLPDISRLPRALEMLGPTALAGVSNAVRDYNEALAVTLVQLEPALGLNILRMDIRFLMDQLLDDTKLSMLKKVKTSVVRKDGSLVKNSDDFLFFDDIHPTAAGHRLIMRAALVILGREIRGDVNADGWVNRDDLKILKKSYGPCTATCPADLNDNGMVDREDLKILRGLLFESVNGSGELPFINRTRGPGPIAAPVQEPSRGFPAGSEG